MTVYDQYYKTADLFGKPYPELIEFFKQYEPKGKLIDVGCGQGRNSIPLAGLGYIVTGIDHSKVGMDQLIFKSRKEGLNVTGIVGDIYAFDNYQHFDIVLLDSMFHFEKQDIKQETGLIGKIAERILNDCLICFCIQDVGRKVKILKETIHNTGLNFEVLNNSSLIYRYEDKESGHKSDTNYCLYIVKKK